MQHSKMYAAEFLGTLALSSIVVLSLHEPLSVPTGVLAALVLMFSIYLFGGISGAHLNPAVTLGALSLKKITPPVAIRYILAQLGGGIVAAIIANVAFGELNLGAAETQGAALGELCGAAVLAFGICSLIYGKIPTDVTGLVGGLALLLGISFASFGGLAIINPAVAIAVGAFNFVYVLVPPIGAILGMQAYSWFASDMKRG